ncbi:ABC transporter ATP-binding protein [Labrys miyagiensis]|uniref:ABC transporter ATP-binding protein n=1 Tax=Labrys miyagiensis TaxID=346912 RepID=A0ABQ6CEF7_9HYPH|nr:ABC transporter ATP-binding protein [Labrys miyagiensis]GLS18643.1 ABC transporter ATP-binding protein [Labrys miyagiensis]
MIDIRGLSVTFRVAGGLTTAVRDVSFSVAAGESFGIVGESGSGKSTVLRAIAGLVEASAGSIAIEGRMLTARRSPGDRRMQQLVFQDPYASLHPRQTVDRQLREPLEIQGLDRPEQRVTEALAAVDLSPQYRYRFPHQLSGGQRQRVAIARALILAPAILLLDEPTSALDVSVQAEILNLLARLRAERGLTSILVSHDLAVVAHLCARVGVMRGGRLLEILDVESLRKGEAREAYTLDLIAMSQGYRRTSAA